MSLVIDHLPHLVPIEIICEQQFQWSGQLAPAIDVLTRMRPAQRAFLSLITSIYTDNSLGGIQCHSIDRYAYQGVFVLGHISISVATKTIT